MRVCALVFASVCVPVLVWLVLTLQCLAAGNQVEVVSLLLMAGARLDVCDWTRTFPYHIAAMHAHPALVRSAQQSNVLIGNSLTVAVVQSFAAILAGAERAKSERLDCAAHCVLLGPHQHRARHAADAPRVGELSRCRCA